MLTTSSRPSSITPCNTVNPKKFKTGFTDPVSTACCGVGKYISIDGACRTISRLCPDRAKSVFWDAFHPTKKMNKICNNQFLFGGLHAISPINVKKLLAV
ncbi:GDSL esterase/lipase LTL1-like [Physcomitrium patens]|uniref:GDSL esterase/lipase LTL1-like n=1 Tax=Physcomitrium patens TaxID=3218 RepID=UPI003CCE040D